MPSDTPWTDDAEFTPKSRDDAVRELLGPAADLPAPPSPDDRADPAEETGGIIPGTGRRAEDHEPAPGPGRDAEG